MLTRQLHELGVGGIGVLDSSTVTEALTLYPSIVSIIFAIIYIVQGIVF